MPCSTADNNAGYLQQNISRVECLICWLLVADSLIRFIVAVAQVFSKLASLYNTSQTCIDHQGTCTWEA